MFSHNEYLKAGRLLSHSGKYWPGRLHPSVQIHHNPIKLADYAIICRFPQSVCSKQIQSVLHKRAVTSSCAPWPDRAPQNPGGGVGSVACPAGGHTPKGSTSMPKATPSWAPGPRRAGLNITICCAIPSTATMSESQIKRLPSFASYTHLSFKQDL